MEIIGILCSFKLVPEWNASKELPESLRLEFSKKISAKTYALLDAKVINWRSLYRGVIASGSDKTFCSISINKFDKFKNPFVTITSLPELGPVQQWFILVVQSKKVIPT